MSLLASGLASANEQSQMPGYREALGRFALWAV